MTRAADLFKQQYHSEPPNDPEWDAATRLAAEYYLQAEAYDRTICHGPIHPEMGALPSTSRERSLSIHHVRVLWSRLERMGYEQGIHPDKLKSARRHLAQWCNNEQMLLDYARRPGVKP